VISYDDAFFRYVNRSALRSARRLIPLLLRQIPVDSVLDVGCGQGAWLAIWKELGVPEIVGIDGSYVDATRLLIPTDAFVPHDLCLSFDLGRRFSIVQSLEVAEHLPESSAGTFIQSLVRHGDIVLFSAAPKGQGGDHHVNEQEYEYWRGHFSQHGYRAIDFVRRRLTSDRDVAPWYRFNTVLYASDAIFESLPATLRAHRVPADKRIADVSPLLYRLRKRVTQLLPVALATRVAKIKERASIAFAAMTEGD
jgi:SAM-dependent methyltransferase